MTKMKRMAILFVLLLMISLACVGNSTNARTFDSEDFSFTIPAGWKTTQEIWGDAAVSGQEYKGLGVQEAVTIQYPAKKGKGTMFFVVAVSPLEEGQSLASRFSDAYKDPQPEIREESRKGFVQGTFSGFEITYERPWGEPWWKFRDVWLEKDGILYVLSFYCSPASFDANQAAFEEILASFQFLE